MAISSLTNFANSVSQENEGINPKKCAAHFDVAGSAERGREDELGQDHEGRDPVSVSPAVFGLCALAPLSLLPDLNDLSHRRDVWSSAGLGQPEQGPIPCATTAEASAGSVGVGCRLAC